MAAIWTASFHLGYGIYMGLRKFVSIILNKCNGVTLQQLEANLISNRVRRYYNNKEKFQQLTIGTSTSTS